MFTGSGHVPYGMHDRFTEGVGGRNNGSTNYDVRSTTRPFRRTISRRCSGSSPIAWAFCSTRSTSRSSTRSATSCRTSAGRAYDNQPYGRADRDHRPAMYPTSHPYSWPVIGSMADLKTASVEDVKNFFRLYYAPNNATLAIVGDFDRRRRRARREVLRRLPRGKAIVRPVVGASALAGEKRLIFEDRVQVPRLLVAWPTVGENSPDEPRARCAQRHPRRLAHGAAHQGARLRQADRRQRQRVPESERRRRDVQHDASRRAPATRSPSSRRRPTRSSRASSATVRRPTSLQRVKAAQQASFIGGLQSNLGKASQLAEDQAFFNDPSFGFRVRVREDAGRDRGRREARREQVSHERARRAEHRADGQDRSSRRMPTRARWSTDPLTEKSGGRNHEHPRFHRARRSDGAASLARVVRADAHRSSIARAIPTAGKIADRARADVDEDHAGRTARSSIVSEKHSLPLVSFTINFVGGSNQFETGGQDRPRRPRRAMMSEGTTTRTGDQTRRTRFQTARHEPRRRGRRGESGSISFQVTTDKFAPTLGAARRRAAASDVSRRGARAAARSGDRRAHAGEGSHAGIAGDRVSEASVRRRIIRTAE